MMDRRFLVLSYSVFCLFWAPAFLFLASGKAVFLSQAAFVIF